MPASLALPSFCQIGWPRSKPRKPVIAERIEVAIPETFSEDQARLVFALKIAELAHEDAARLLQDWTPSRLSPAQAACALELLSLDLLELPATLADAMAPGPLRGQWMRGRNLNCASLLPMLREIASKVGQGR